MSAFAWLPSDFTEWMPLTQAVALALFTFVQEDVPTVGAALLAAGGGMTWSAGFLGCFFGIWIGDALLYLFARGLGRPWVERSWARRFFDPKAVAESEKWFARRGTWFLLSSRFIPGTRLPTYLAAGFLKLPFARFLLVTGLAVAFWTVGIFLLAYLFGARLLEWIKKWNVGGWAFLFVIIVIVILSRMLPRMLRRDQFRRWSADLGRWRRWEFWPPWLFYGPVVAHYLWLTVRYRSATLPSRANPGISAGGFVGESKIATLKDLRETSPEFTAEAYLVEGDTLDQRTNFVGELQARARIEYPFILKPDVGQRGLGVKLIREPAQLHAYLKHTDRPLIVQRYCPSPFEVGIFYYRLPSQSHGRIFAITEKIFPFVTGDGERTVEELIWADPRARLIAQKYLKRLAERRGQVLPAGEKLKLVEAGNHAQGCIFRDGWRLYSPALEQRIDAISRKLNGFFIGRYDIRYASEADLLQGQNFQIIELNGASSEATNIYDARNSLFTAYRTLFRQWALVFAIGHENRQRGVAPTSLVLLWRRWREGLARAGSYPLAD
jgi:membrane protein DedA with SNARE-associated domain